MVVLDNGRESVYEGQASQKHILLWSTQSDFLYFRLKPAGAGKHVESESICRLGGLSLALKKEAWV